MKSCVVESCKNKHRAKGYCGKHYKQWRNNRLGKTETKDGLQGCRIANCQNKHEAIGFCSKHYKRFRRGTLTIEGQSVKKRLTCKVSNCLNERATRGYCESHYHRLLLIKNFWHNKSNNGAVAEQEESGSEGNYRDVLTNIEESSTDLGYNHVREEDLYEEY